MRARPDSHLLPFLDTLAEMLGRGVEEDLALREARLKSTRPRLLNPRTTPAVVAMRERLAQRRASRC